MRYNKNTKKYYTITVLICLCILLLTGCEEDLVTITRKNADGTTTTMECMVDFFPIRSGCHTMDGKFIMQSSSKGNYGYTAEIISKEEKEAYDSKKILGKSTNLTAYEGMITTKIMHMYIY